MSLFIWTKATRLIGVEDRRSFREMKFRVSTFFRDLLSMIVKIYELYTVNYDY